MENTENCSQIGFGECPLVGVIKYCFEIDGDFVCDCPSWFGYVGPNCDQPSKQLRYYQATSTIILILVLMSTSSDLYITFKVFRFYFSSRCTKELRSRLFASQIPLVLAFGLLKHLVFVTFSSVHLRSAYNPNTFKFEEAKGLLLDSSSYTYATNGRLYLGTLYASFSLLLLQTLAICSSWISTIEKLPDFMLEFKYHKSAVFFRKISPLLFTAFTLCWTIYIAVGFFGDTAALLAIFAVLFLVLFIFARYDFMRTLKTTNPVLTEQMKKPLALIKVSSALIIFFWLIFWAAFLINALTLDLSINTPPGNFILGSITQDIAVVAASGLSITLTWYVSQVLQNFDVNVLPNIKKDIKTDKNNQHHTLSIETSTV